MNTWYMRALFVTALLVSTACSVAEMRQSVAAALQPRVPRRHVSCNMCHNSAMPVKGEVLFAAQVDPSSQCLNTRCHPSYRANHHPVDFVPPSNEFVSPGAELPLVDGKIRCFTCHDVHAGPDYAETPKLLRGGYPDDVASRDRRRLCFKCHFKDKYADINPHVMLDADGNPALVQGKPNCLLCHETIPDSKSNRRSDVRFRADVGFICWRCHPPMPGEFFDQHFLIKPSPRIRDEIDRSEKSVHAIFPLVPRGRITCSTCHNPHQKEVLRDDRSRTGAGEPKRLRIPPVKICRICHATD